MKGAYANAAIPHFYGNNDYDNKRAMVIMVIIIIIIIQACIIIQT
jgi:hypothetical protein